MDSKKHCCKSMSSEDKASEIDVANAEDPDKSDVMNIFRSSRRIGGGGRISCSRQRKRGRLHAIWSGRFAAKPQSMMLSIVSNMTSGYLL